MIWQHTCGRLLHSQVIFFACFALQLLSNVRSMLSESIPACSAMRCPSFSLWHVVVERKLDVPLLCRSELRRSHSSGHPDLR